MSANSRLACRLRNRLEGRSQLLDGVLVADFQDPERLVDAEPVAGGVGVRLRRAAGP